MAIGYKTRRTETFFAFDIGFSGNPSTMSLHAMPVMLGVLAILAIAYRYYSAFSRPASPCSTTSGKPRRTDFATAITSTPPTAGSSSAITSRRSRGPAR